MRDMLGHSTSELMGRSVLSLAVEGQQMQQLLGAVLAGESEGTVGELGLAARRARRSQPVCGHLPFVMATGIFAAL